MKRTLLFCWAGVCLALVAGCKSDSSKERKTAQFTDFQAVGVTPQRVTNELSPELLRPATNLFTLGPGDRLDIEIIGQPRTRTETAVGPDGKLYFHLLPGLDVWGLTLGQTQDQIEKQLGKYLTSPQVSLGLRSVGSKYVWLLGRLNRPGVYPLSGPMSLLECLALAGGTARSASQLESEELADLRHSFVMRQGQLLPVDFYRLLHQGDTTQNIMLQADDFVFVPSALSQEVYVLGAVHRARAIPYTEHMTLISAIAGGDGPVRYDWINRYETGLLKDAYLSHVAIVRGSLAEPQISIVDLGAIMKGKAPNVRLEPGDIVYVPNSPYRWLKSYANMIVNTFVATVSANEGINAGGGQQSVGVSVPVGGR